MVRWRGWSPRAPAPATESACANGARSVAHARAGTIARFSRRISRGRKLRSSTRTEGRKDGRTVGAVLVILSVLPSFRLSAQGVLNQFSYDNLRFSGIQADVGLLGASNLTGALAGGVRVDYGKIAPKVRVLFGLSYFRSQFSDQARARFVQRLKSIVIDPSRDDTIRVGRISLSDVIGDVDFQFVFPQGQSATVYLGTGVGIHVRNGRGAAIKGTFVEDALDVITAGLNGSMGAEFRLSPAWRLTVDGRGTVSSGLNTVSLRTGVMYRVRGGREEGAGQKRTIP